MNIDSDPTKTSNSTVVGILLVFFLVGLAMVIHPVNLFQEMLVEIQTHAEYVTFRKGGFYLFGGGLFCLVLSTGIFVAYVFIDKNKESKVFIRIFVFGLLASLTLILIIPAVMHIFIDEELIKKDYQECQSKSRQWLHVRTIVYGRDGVCGK